MFQLGHFLAEMDRGENMDNSLLGLKFQLGHFLAEMDRRCQGVYRHLVLHVSIGPLLSRNG